MVFDNLEDIAKLTLQEKIELLNPNNSFEIKTTLHRSNMMLNPLNLKHLNRLDSLKADAVTLNLEDAIAPSKKQEALINIALFLSHIKETKSEIIIRINPLNLGGIEEIKYLKDFNFNAIRVSKVKNRFEIEQVLDILPKPKEIHISLETKEAFNSLHTWGNISRFTRANIGILDLLASLNLPQSLLKIGNPTIAYILSKFLIDSKTIDIEATSFMFQDYANTKLFREFCLWERELGFNSKACMGPAQVKIANEIFKPSKDEIDRAFEIKKLFEASSKNGITGFMHDKYGFIDEPIYKDALNLLSNLK